MCQLNRMTWKCGRDKEGCSYIAGKRHEEKEVTNEETNKMQRIRKKLCEELVMHLFMVYLMTPTLYPQELALTSPICGGRYSSLFYIVAHTIQHGIVWLFMIMKLRGCGRSRSGLTWDRGLRVVSPCDQGAREISLGDRGVRKVSLWVKRYSETPLRCVVFSVTGRILWSLFLCHPLSRIHSSLQS
jgi:hypothetical protein